MLSGDKTQRGIVVPSDDGPETIDFLISSALESTWSEIDTDLATTIACLAAGRGH